MPLTARFAALLFLVLGACAHHGNDAEHEHAHAHEHSLEQAVLRAPAQPQAVASSATWAEKYGTQPDLGYTGPLAFAHINYARCLEDTAAAVPFDVAVLGMPFDTSVTYRPGARFGPAGIRTGSRRQNAQRAYTLAWGFDPYKQGATVVDCGDVPVNPFDNALALDQMEVAYASLLARPVANATLARSEATRALAKDGRAHPRIVTLGGDHTIVLPILRALNGVYGPVSVIHFDAHLDTWAPPVPAPSDQSRITHGTFFHVAREEGLLRNASVHAGIRTKMAGIGDVENDESNGFRIVSTEDLDDIGLSEVVRRIRAHVGDRPVYLSLDIDVIDPGLAPATGTPEAGGWTTREVKRILRGLAGLNIVGADIVEVAPAYDHADVTSIAAADIVHDFLGMLMSAKPPKSRDERRPWDVVQGRDEL
ncbi:arginase family-domain-containing protein [Vararia minispora EC-137]|uniref:Arginase family-domain-containing protein n=1 Tax=Vararia minispora EC-137 TaxID=1314806 RepID=A0ACB8Q7Y5_9AGAM|nr:arginase family-domain-containing protein [Vararia minispora EC-137]